MHAQTKKERITRGSNEKGNKKQYLRFCIPVCCGGKSKRNVQVHIIVACTFLEFKSYADGWTVEHINGTSIKYPNDKSNLKWLPNTNKLAAEVGLPTNQAAFYARPGVKQAKSESTGITIWSRSKVDGASTWSEWTRWPSKTQFFEKGGCFEVTKRCKGTNKNLKHMILKGAKHRNQQTGTTFQATDKDPSL